MFYAICIFDNISSNDNVLVTYELNKKLIVSFYPEILF